MQTVYGCEMRDDANNTCIGLQPGGVEA